MKTSFILEYPWWFVLLCAALAFVLAWLLYGQRPFIFREGESPWWKRGLFALRFLAVFLIAFLLLSPLVRTKSTREDKPVILFLQDNSASLKTSFGPFPQATYKKQLQELIDAIGDAYEVVPYNFGDQLLEFSEPAFDQQETDIAGALDAAFVRYDDRNIGAVVLASDGIYNKGNSPLYNRNIAQVPVFTILLGDTAIRQDAFIRHVQYPDIVYLGDQFTIQAEIEANHLQGKTTQLEIVAADGKILFSQAVAITSDHFVWKTEVVADAGQPGVQVFQVRLKPVPGEQIAGNNNDAVYVDVIDGRQRVLILYDAPHPDVKAIRSAIESNKNYEVSVEPLQSFSRSYKEYDLIILHGIPAAGTAGKLSWLQELVQSDRSLWFILSANTQLPMFNQLQTGLQVTGSSQSGNEVTPVFQSAFSKFTLSDNALKLFPLLPPVISPYGKYQAAAGADIMFRQQLGKVPTGNPLFAVFDVNGKKTGIFAGEGLWRWRMHEYLQNKRYDATDEFINKTVQYLTVKGDKRRFRVHAPKNIFNANEPVLLDAELYNESYELINEPDASVSVRDAGGKTYEYVFDKTANAYTLHAGMLPVGSYTANAKTDHKGQAYTASVNFSVRPVNVEQLRIQADHNLLRTLSGQTGGKSYTPQQMGQIAKAIEADKQIRSVLYDSVNTRPLIDWKLIFVVVLLLLAAEWFIRKYNGLI